MSFFARALIVFVICALGLIAYDLAWGNPIDVLHAITVGVAGVIGLKASDRKKEVA